jgi:hypothetical protein
VDLVLGSLSISRQVCAQPSSQLRHDHLDAHLLLALDGALDGRLLDAMLMLMSMLPTAIALDAVAVALDSTLDDETLLFIGIIEVSSFRHRDIGWKVEG